MNNFPIDVQVESLSSHHTGHIIALETVELLLPDFFYLTSGAFLSSSPPSLVAAPTQPLLQVLSHLPNLKLCSCLSFCLECLLV